MSVGILFVLLFLHYSNFYVRTHPSRKSGLTEIEECAVKWSSFSTPVSGPRLGVRLGARLGANDEHVFSARDIIFSSYFLEHGDQSSSSQCYFVQIIPKTQCT